MTTTSGPEKLETLLDSDGLTVAGGAYDVMSAVLVEQAEYEAIYVTGAGVTMSRLGVPDLGLITMPEMLETAGRIARRCDVPVISDIDTGFGGTLNVARTIEEFGLAGVAAVHLEDQVFPKRCGHLSGKEVIPSEEYVQKVRAAIQAREGSGLKLIARTDARSVEGIDAAIDRVNAAMNAGADIAFVEALESTEDLEAVSERVEGPKLYGMVANGRSPDLTFAMLEELGFSITLMPQLAWVPAYDAIRRHAAEVKERGSDEPLRKDGMGPLEMFEAFGLQEWLAVDEQAANPA
jgi:2-methylisocitrate lyase-like PEP mutase family enzyme